MATHSQALDFGALILCMWMTECVRAQPVDSVVAWGANFYGECDVPEPNSGFVAVAGGGHHSLGLRDDGSIEAWGMYFVGQCDVPEPNSGFVAVGAGDYHSLGLRADGSIEAWGSNTDPYGDYSGQCDVPEPNSGFVAISAGGDHSLAVRADGSIEAWGSNEFGQSDVPAPNTGFVAVSAGYGHSLGLRADGSVVAWGANYAGECDVPVPNTGFVAVSAGTLLSLGLREDGSIAAWGDNQHGQCNVPEPNSGFVVVEAGDWHGLGIRADGSIAAWGLNSSGQCDAPTSSTGYGAVAGGDWHSLGIINADTDRDDLLDDWERKGLPWVDGGDTIQRLVLPGADWRHKDLYIEVDAMVDRAPTQIALNMVSQAFAAAPNDLVKNPDNRNGITVHFEGGGVDDSDITQADWPDAWGGFDAVKAVRFGTSDQRTHSEWDNIRTAKALAYRYCIFANSIDGDEDGVLDSTSGMGELPGNDCMVTLGHADWQVFFQTSFGSQHEDRTVAGTVMHELGHTLSLRHGGSDHLAFKPNFHSVMNYLWQYPQQEYSSSWTLDYSRAAFHDLYESRLDETDGVGGHAGHRVPVGSEPRQLVDESGAVDWNRNGLNDDTGVPADINGDGVYDLLNGHEDWSSLYFRRNENWEPGVHLILNGSPADLVEMTWDMYDSMYEGCRADLNGDGVVNTQDFLTYLNAWATGDPLADWNGDGTVNTQDFLAYLNDWSAGC